MMKTHIDISLLRIRSFVRCNGWSNLKFAQKAGIRESTIRKLFDDDYNPTVSTLRKMEAVIPPDFLPEPHQPPRKESAQ